MNNTDTYATIENADYQSKMASYITTQYGSGSSDDIRVILNETKVGAWRRPTLQKMLNTVFTNR
jgi:hypothetical protein